MAVTTDDDVLREFLLESSENLNQLDRDFVALEKDPTKTSLLAAIFRVIHTIKGTAGFFSFAKLGALTHVGESVLARLRDGELILDTPTTTALLAMVDAVRKVLASIEETQGASEGDFDVTPVVNELTRIGARTPTARRGADVRRESLTGDLTFFSAIPSAPARLSVVPFAFAPALVPASLIAAPAPAPAPVAPATPPGPTAADTAIRVDVGLLDHVMNLVGELVLARNQLIQFGAASTDPAFIKASQRLSLLTSELQEGVMKTRMQPIGNVWNKLPRVVRDLAHQTGKRVDLELDGSETELDRTIIEAIKDPLTHAVRNSVDHGIELPAERVLRGKPPVGRLFLRAFHEGGQVNIEVTDDGTGLDVERIRRRAVERGIITPERAGKLSERESMHLIFAAGFSTADSVTTVSGRGVGMDVVRTNVEKIGGSVDVTSELGKGTTLRIKIPLTLAIVPALIVKSCGERFAIPQVNLLELIRLEGQQVKKGIERLFGGPQSTYVYRLRGSLLPLVFLDQTLGLRATPTAGMTTTDDEDRVVTIVVLQADDRQFGLVVDEINDTEEIVVKPLGKELKNLTAFAGATIMGDGRVALILDVLGVARVANVLSTKQRTLAVEGASTPSGVVEGASQDREPLLLFEIDGSRMAVPLEMVARIEEIPRASVETSLGLDKRGPCMVVQYRGALLPLVDLAMMFGKKHGAKAEMLEVIVIATNGQTIGLVVGAIIDVVDEVVTKQRGGRAIAGTAIAQGRVTDVIEVRDLLSLSAMEDAA